MTVHDLSTIERYPKLYLLHLHNDLLNAMDVTNRIMPSLLSQLSTSQSVFFTLYYFFPLVVVHNLQ